MPHDESLTISRRRLLGGLVTITGASTVGGMGTTAVLSDDERFANGQLVAGELNVTVGWEERYSDRSADEAAHAHLEDGTVVVDDRQGFMEATLQEQFPDEETRDRLSDGTADPCDVLVDISEEMERPVVDLTDVKPGDSGELAFDVALCTNPGYLWLDGALLASRDEGFTEPERTDPDEYSDGSPPTSGNAGVLTVTNEVLEVNISADLSGSLGGQPWIYTYPDGSTENFLFFEIYALRDDANRGETVAGEFEADFPATGVPGTAYPATFTTTVNGVSLSVTRTFTLDPTDGLLTVEYGFENVDGTDAIEDLRFTQYVDYDVGDFSNVDVGQFRSDESRSLDYVTQTERPGFGDEMDLYAGFGAVQSSVAHDVGPSMRVLNDAFSPARLGNTDAYEGQVGFSLEYSVGRLDPGDTATLTTAFAVARSPRILKALLLKPRLPLGDGDLLDAVRTALWFENRENVCFEGSLAHFLALAATGNGLPLDGIGDDFDEVLDDPTSAARDCVASSPAVHNLGLRWTLPVDHANELQGDSSRFGIGFYAEQCRHNDGREL